MKRLLSKLFSQPQAVTAPIDPDPLDEALLYFSENERDAWTLRNACEGTLILGGTGSGKSSGSGRCLARALLAAGAG